MVATVRCFPPAIRGALIYGLTTVDISSTNHEDLQRAATDKDLWRKGVSKKAPQKGGIHPQIIQNDTTVYICNIYIYIYMCNMSLYIYIYIYI